MTSPSKAEKNPRRATEACEALFLSLELVEGSNHGNCMLTLCTTELTKHPIRGQIGRLIQTLEGILVIRRRDAKHSKGEYWILCAKQAQKGEGIKRQPIGWGVRPLLPCRSKLGVATPQQLQESEMISSPLCKSSSRIPVLRDIGHTKAPTTMHPQNESPLFQLPAELRESVQRFSLLPRSRDESKLLEEARFTDVVFRTGERPVPALMRTCKKMYREMSPFAFTEIIVHISPYNHGTSHRLLSHGNLRFERLRHISVIYSREDSPYATNFSVCRFLPNLLNHCPEVSRLDIEFHDCEFHLMEEAILAAEERRRSEPGFRFMEYHAKPLWLKGIIQQPNLRLVSFEGDVPDFWLKTLRRESKGRIQVLNNGVRFKDEQQESHTRDELAHGELDGDTLVDPSEAKSDESAHSLARGGAAGLEDIQFQVVYEPASRFD